MTIAGMVALLAADSGISPLVVAPGGVFQDALPRGYGFPALVVHRYGKTQGYELAGPDGITEDQVQVDVYGKTPATRDAVVQAVRNLLVPYTGTLSDGTVVQACYLERDMDMPFLQDADTTGNAFRTILGFRVVSVRS